MRDKKIRIPRRMKAGGMIWHTQPVFSALISDPSPLGSVNARPWRRLQAYIPCRSKGTTRLRFFRWAEIRADARSIAASPVLDSAAADRQSRLRCGAACFQFAVESWRHAATGLSQSPCFSFLPLTQSKNSFCNLAVIGPIVPLPMVRPSSSRIGVTSAAVPVKNASSAM